MSGQTAGFVDTNRTTWKEETRSIAGLLNNNKKICKPFADGLVDWVIHSSIDNLLINLN
jgi:hypothetical protein